MRKFKGTCSLDDFFIDNNDENSIGVNIYPDKPSLQTFYELFKKIKSSNKTENIFVHISDIEDTDWFFTDTVYIIGDWTANELKEILKDIHPDEIYERWLYGKPTNIPETTKKVFSVWWD